MGLGKIGAKIVLEGEAAYRKALRDINAEQKELRSEMKLCNTQFKDSQNSMEALSKKYTILSKSLDTSAQKVALYEKALQTSTQKEAEASKRIEELKTKLDSAQKEFEEMSKSSETTADAMQKQQEAIDKLGKELENANTDYDKAVTASKKYQTQLNNANAEMVEFENELRDTKKYMEEAERSSDGMAHSIDEFGDSVKDAEDKTNNFGDVLKANLASEVIVSGVKALVKGIKEVAEACIETGMQFEASMSNVQALSGATNQELEQMSNKAKELGASTIFSASEVADAMSYMALAGWNTQQTLVGVDAVLNLAAASSMDLGRASDIVTDYLTAFGLKAEDAGRFTDQLAYAMANSNTTVEMLGEAYKNCASAASSMGFSVEDVTSALMVMANAGVKGGEAGTSLRSIMVNLATNTKGCADALAEFGVEVYDATTGDMNSLADILIGTAAAFEGLSDQEANALAKTIAGKTQFAGFETILLGLNDAAKESGMSFEDYADALLSCDGYAKNMADTMQNNLKGKIVALQSALDGLKISTYEVFSDNLKEGVEAATNAVSRLNKSVTSGSMRTSLTKLSQSIGELIEKVSNWAEKNLPKIIDGFAILIDHSGEISAAIGGIVAGLVAFKTASVGVAMVQTAMAALKTVTEGATVAQIAMNTAANANPYVLLASAIIGVTVAVGGLAMELERQDRAGQIACDNLIRGYEDVSNALSETTSKMAGSFSNDYIHSLVLEFQRLNSVENLSEEQKRRLAQVVKELNLYYADLNLQIDENTGKVRGNTKEVNAQVNTLDKQRRIAEAQSQIAEAYAKRKDAQEALTAQNNRLIWIESEYASQIERINELEAKNGMLTNSETSELQKLKGEIANVIDEWVELPGSIEGTEDAIATADRNIDHINSHLIDMYGVMIDANGQIVEVDTSMRQFAESTGEVNREITTLSEEASEKIYSMYETVGKSISGQMDLFSEWNEKQKVNYTDLIKNLDDQTTALEKWSENLAYLSEKGIDEGLYAKLAAMGPEGAAYVQAFVDMATKDNKAWDEYQDNFKKAVAIQDTTAQEITQEYAELGGYIIEGMVLGLEDKEAVTVAIGTVSQDVFDAYCDANEMSEGGYSQKYADAASGITEGMATGIEDGEQDVIDTVEMVADDTVKTAKTGMDSETFEGIGYNIDAGMAAGIRSGKSEVVNAVAEVCAEAVTTAQTELDIHSPSRKFRWLGEMSGEGYIMGLQESMDGVSATINSAMGSMESVGSVAAASSNPISQLLQLVGEYLPEIAEKDMNVNVTAEADADGIFKIVQKKSRQYTKATGAYAF